jgi:hypothetical protein
MFKDNDLYSGMMSVINETKEFLQKHEIQALYIPYKNGIEVEISNDITEEGLKKIYNEKQSTEGFRDGFIKALSDSDEKLEYDDSHPTKSEIYSENYKLAYKMAWEHRNEEN